MLKITFKYVAKLILKSCISHIENIVQRYAYLNQDFFDSHRIAVYLKHINAYCEFIVSIDMYRNITTCKLHSISIRQYNSVKQLLHVQHTSLVTSNKNARLSMIDNAESVNLTLNFVVKPGYPIFAKNIYNGKSQVQKTETFAFARALSSIHKFRTKPIVVCYDDNIAMPKSVQNVLACGINEATTIADSSEYNIWVVNFVWPEIEDDTFKQHKQLIENCKGKVIFLWWDLREHMMPKLDKFNFSASKVIVLTQAKNIEGVKSYMLEHLWHKNVESVDIMHANLHALPAFYWCKANYKECDEANMNVTQVNYNDGKLNAIYPICRWKDMSIQRQVQLRKLFLDDRLHVNVCGNTEGLPEDVSGFINIYGIIPCENIIQFMSHFNIMPIINETIAETLDAPSFRTIEAMLANIIAFPSIEFNGKQLRSLNEVYGMSADEWSSLINAQNDYVNECKTTMQNDLTNICNI